MANYVAYDHLSESYQAFITATSTLKEPVSYTEACKDPRWIEAMQAEIEVLQNNNTWVLTDLSKGKHLLGANGFIKLSINPPERLKGSRQDLLLRGTVKRRG